MLPFPVNYLTTNYTLDLLSTGPVLPTFCLLRRPSGATLPPLPVQATTQICRICILTPSLEIKMLQKLALLSSLILKFTIAVFSLLDDDCQQEKLSDLVKLYAL